MKASTLVTILQQAIAEEGDVTVMIYDSRYDEFDPVNAVRPSFAGKLARYKGVSPGETILLVE